MYKLIFLFFLFFNDLYSININKKFLISSIIGLILINKTYKDYGNYKLIKDKIKNIDVNNLDSIKNLNFNKYSSFSFSKTKKNLDFLKTIYPKFNKIDQKEIINEIDQNNKDEIEIIKIKKKITIINEKLKHLNNNNINMEFIENLKNKFSIEKNNNLNELYFLSTIENIENNINSLLNEDEKKIIIEKYKNLNSTEDLNHTDNLNNFIIDDLGFINKNKLNFTLNFSSFRGSLNDKYNNNEEITDNNACPFLKLIKNHVKSLNAKNIIKFDLNILDYLASGNEEEDKVFSIDQLNYFISHYIFQDLLKNKYQNNIEITKNNENSILILIKKHIQKLNIENIIYFNLNILDYLANGNEEDKVFSIDQLNYFISHYIFQDLLKNKYQNNIEITKNNNACPLLKLIKNNVQNLNTENIIDFNLNILNYLASGNKEDKVFSINQLNYFINNYTFTNLLNNEYKNNIEITDNNNACPLLKLIKNNVQNLNTENIIDFNLNILDYLASGNEEDKVFSFDKLKIIIDHYNFANLLNNEYQKDKEIIDNNACLFLKLIKKHIEKLNTKGMQFLLFNDNIKKYLNIQNN